MNRKLHFSVLTLVAILFLIKSGNNCFAGNNNPTATKEQAKQWMKSQPVQFLENKGQMTDMNHQLVPYVLFKAEGKGMNLYITETGLTYVFIKAEHKMQPPVFDPKNGGLPFDRMGMHDNEGRKIEWNRIDMQLKGAKISKENIIKEGASKDFKQYFLGHCPDGITDVHKKTILMIFFCTYYEIQLMFFSL